MKVFYTTLSLLALCFCTLQMQGQDTDLCDDAGSVGLIFCSFGQNQVYGPVDTSFPYTPDSEADDCLNGVNTGWYEFEIHEEVGEVIIDIVSGDIELFEGSCGSLNPLAGCSDFPFSIEPDPSTTYYVLLDATTTTQFELSTVVPENEECDDATELSGSLTDQTNVCASDAEGDCGGTNSVWYEVEISDAGTTLEIEVSALTISDPMVAIYEFDCSGDQVSEGNCDEMATAECLAPGSYFIEVSTNADDEGTFDITATLTTGPDNDLCDDAEELNGGNALLCGDEIDQDAPPQACFDPQNNGCVTNGVWYTFTTDASLSSFMIDGEFELFEGSCGSLNFLADCNGSLPYEHEAEDGVEYFILLEEGENVEITTPEPPDYTDCGSAIDVNDPSLPSDLVNCCSSSGSVFFSVEPSFEGQSITFTNIDLGDPSVTIYDASCGTVLFSETDDFTADVPHCDETIIIEVSTASEDCGTFNLQVFPTACDLDNEIWAEDCDDAIDIGSPVTNDPPICFDSCNQFACDGDCGEPNGVWFLVETDEDASAMIVSVEGIDPIISIFQVDCDGDASVNCAGEEEVELAVSGNQTYVIEVSTSGEPGPFEICVSTEIIEALCSEGELESSRPDSDGDPEGPFCIAEKVDFVYDVAFTIDPIGQGNNCQWLQGIIPSFGEGWDLDACHPSNFSPEGGGWNWLDEGEAEYNFTSQNLSLQASPHGGNELVQTPGSGNLVTGDPIPMGWWYTSSGSGPNCSGSSDPDLTWGLPGGCGSSYTVRVEFSLQVKEDIDLTKCDDEDYLKVHIFTMADGQTGCWVNNACDADDPAINNYQVDCSGDVTIIAPDEYVVCHDFEDFEIFLEASDGRSDIFVEINEDDSDSFIGDAEEHEFSGGDGEINDQLKNQSCRIGVLVYQAYAINEETGCKGPIHEIEVTVYPEIEISSDLIDNAVICPGEGFLLEPMVECTFGDVEYNWSNGSTEPFVMLPHEGYNPEEIEQRICLDVVDDEIGCANRLCWDYNVLPHPRPRIEGPEEVCIDGVSDNPQYCVLIDETITTIELSDYEILWSFTPSGIELDEDTDDDEPCIIVDEENSLPGTYTFKVTLEDEEGCIFDTTMAVVLDSGPALEWGDTECLPNGNYLVCGMNTNANVAATLYITQYDPANGIMAGDTLAGPVAINELCAEITNPDLPIFLNGASSGGCIPDPERLDIQPPPDPNILVTPPSICEGQMSTLTLSNDPLDFPGGISWTDGTQTWTTPTIQVSPTSTTSYTFSGVDAQGCVINENIEVEVNPNPSVSISGSASYCPGASTELTAVGSGGTPPYTYTWPDNSNGENFIASSEGTIVVLIEDDRGCTDMAEIEITEEDELMPQVTVPLFCEGTEATLDGGTGFDTYTWLDDLGYVVGMGQMYSTSIEGTYTLQVAAGGCSGSTDVQVMAVADLPDAMVPESFGPICNEDIGTDPTTVTLNNLVMNGVTGVWTEVGTNTVVSGSIEIDFSGFTPGGYDYLFTAEASDPCFDDTYNLTINVIDCGCPDLTTGIVPDYCNNTTNTIDLTQLPPISTTENPGTWEISGGNLTIENDMISIDEATEAATYTLVYTLTDDPAPCPRQSEPVTFEVFPALTAELRPETICNVSINGESTVLDLDVMITSGNINGVWTSADPTLIINGDNEVDFVGLPVGSEFSFNYSLTETGSPCPPFSDDITVRVRDCACPELELLPLPALCNSGDVLFVDEEIYFTASEQGSWTVDPDLGQLMGSRFDASDIPPADYTVRFTYNVPIQGCDEFVEQVITVNAPPVAELDPELAIVCNGTNITSHPVEINLNDYVNGDEGEWTADPNYKGGVIDDVTQVNFEGVVRGDYVFTFTTTNADEPCENITLELDIDVRPCDCPIPEFDFGTLCNNLGTINLNDYVTNFDDLPSGSSWRFNSGASNATMIGASMVNLTNLDAGMYAFDMILNDVPSGCGNTHPAIFSIERGQEADLEPNVTACNREKTDGTHCIDLDDVVSGATGAWTDFGNFPGDVSDINRICFDGQTIGSTFTFTYTIDNSGNACEDEMLMTTITVLDCDCPNLIISDPDQTCNEGTLDLASLENSMIAPGSWTVMGPNGDVPLNGTELDLSTLEEDSYQLIYTPDVMPDPECDPNSQTTLQVFNQLEAGQAMDYELCVDEIEVIMLANQIDGDVGGAWSETGANLSTGNAFDPSQGTFNTDGQREGLYEFTYTIAANGPCGEDVAVLEITLEGLPTADAGTEQTISCEEMAQLGGPGTSTGADYSYSWSRDGQALDETDPMIAVAQPGTYELVVTDINTQCSSVASVVINAEDNSLDVDSQVNEPPCNGQPGFILVSATGGDENYQYSIDGGQTFQDSGEFPNLEPGTYELIIIDGAGCRITRQYFIQDPPELSVNAGENREVDFGDEVYDISIALPAEINSDSIAMVTWTLSETGEILCSGSFNDCSTIDVDPQIFSTYCVEVVDVNGCEAMSCVTLREKVVRDVFIPNTFDPNNDDPANNTFHPFADQFVERIDYIRIFDRWGELVYFAPEHSPNEASAFGWNGGWENELNKKVEQGVYVYVIKVTYVDNGFGGANEEIFAGDITILR